jgi:peroxiredoxin
MPAEPERVRVGADAPDFTLPSTGRGRIRLADYRGHEQVLLVFLRAFG